MNYDLMDHLIVDEELRQIVCLHESAHAEYMEQLGDVYVEFVPLFEDCYAAVTNHSPEQELVQMKSNLTGWVKSTIAGELVTEFLLDIKYGGVSDDKDVEEAFNLLDVSPKKRKRILKKARKQILKDLLDPEFCNALRARTRFFEGILEHHLAEELAALRTQMAE